MFTLRTRGFFFSVLIGTNACTQSWATEIETSERGLLLHSTGGSTAPLAPDTFDYEGFMAHLAKDSDQAIEQLYVDLGPKQRHRLLRRPDFNKYLLEIADIDRNRLLLMLDPLEFETELTNHLNPPIAAAFEQFQNHLITCASLTDLCQDARHKRQNYIQQRRLKFLNDLIELPGEQARSLVTGYVDALWSYNKFSFILTLDMIQGFLKNSLGSSDSNLLSETDVGKLIGQGVQVLAEKFQNFETQCLKRSYEFTPEILHARHALARSYLMHQVFLREIWNVSQWEENVVPKVYKTQKLNGLLDEYAILTKMMFTFLDQEAQKARASLEQKDS